MDITSTVSGGDLAMAAEVFRRYDADGSGRLDRFELLAALRDLGLLARVSASAAGRALAEMDSNGDGQVSWDEFREAFGRLAKLKAAEQRAARTARAAPPIPPNAATCPRLRAAFDAFAAYGAAKGLSERGAPGERGEGLTSRQFQRACAAAALPIQQAAVDVVFTCARKGAKTLRFPRFLEALAQVSAEAAVPLETILDAIRACAPAAASGPAKEVDSRLPLSARAKGRPRSAGPSGTPPPGSPGAAGEQAAPGAAPASPPDAAAAPAAKAAAPSPSPAGYAKLEQRFCTLQQLLDDPAELDAILAHPAPAVQPAAAPAAPGAQQAQQPAQQAQQVLQNPTYQTATQGEQEPPADLAALKLSLLDLLDQRCEAAERACQALVATRAEMTAQLVQQLQSGLAAGQREAAAAALHKYEARLAALEAAAGEGAAAAAREFRAAVAAMEARLAEVQKGQEEAMGRVNAALLAIARKVGELVAGRQ